MPSFDIVNTFDMQEIDNAVNTVKRDILTRYGVIHQWCIVVGRYVDEDADVMGKLGK